LQLYNKIYLKKEILYYNIMVLYICNKCNKHFSRKQSYNIHVNRINPCILDENINKIKELEYNNQLEKTVEELKNTINNFEEKIKLLEEKNIILHTQNNDKDKCLKKKDLEIKNLYKNIYTKNTDIQIKKIQEYVYIIRECDFVRLNENIYKIGRTAKANPEDRFQKYRKGTEIVGFFGVKDSNECENLIIKCFTNHTNIKKMNEYGKEYFQGNKNELLKEILQIVENYNS
jgi:hypothetical protein